MLKIKPWIVDAAKITDMENGSNNSPILLKTNLVSEFIDNSSKNFISATKGLGKTFILKVKSHSIRNSNQGAIFIPKVDLVDKIGSGKASDISSEVYGQYNKVEVHEQLWHYAFVLTVIRNSQELIDAINHKNIIYPKDILPKEADYPLVKSTYSELLNNYRLFRDINNGAFFSDFETTLHNFNTATYIFIDNVDEFYDNTKGAYYEELWFVAQIALLKSVTKLTDDYKHLHIYGTLRKKAIDKFERSKDIMYAQVMDSVVELTYTKDDLRKIFINNIRAEKKERLYNKDKSLLKNNPIESFLGFDKLSNKFIEGNINEELFDYIYRHTLGRPRDLMRMGDKISLLEIARRDIDTIRKTINSIAKDNGRQYIKEIDKFVDIDFEKDIYERVDTNIYGFDNLKNICCMVNEESSKDCENCTKRHIFCTLYSYGLVGFEHKNNAIKKCTQQFVSAGIQPVYDLKHKLPISPRYFIHPCLAEVIEDYRKEKKLEEFVHNKQIVVGYDNLLECTEKHDIPTTIKCNNGLTIGKYPVTFNEYNSYCNSKNINPPTDNQWGRGRRPVINVSYSNAIGYCNWLGEETGDIYRLPTKQEWEECCKENINEDIIHRDNSENKTAPTNRDNKDKICDMLGNVWEWCSDDHNSKQKYIKGGSYTDHTRTLKCESSGAVNADKTENNIGFRVVKEESIMIVS